MEFGKQFTPSNSPPPPGYGQMWEGTTGVTPRLLLLLPTLKQKTDRLTQTQCTQYLRNSD